MWFRVFLFLIVTKLLAAQSAEQRLKALLDAEWEYSLKRSPINATYFGEKRYNDRWNDVSLAAMAGDYQHDRELLAQLAKINRAELPASDQLNYDLFKRQYQVDLEAEPFRLYLLAIQPRDGIQFIDDLGARIDYRSAKDYQDWLTRLQTFDQYAEQTMALLREGIRTGIVQPRVVMERVPKTLERQVVADATESGFYKPFKKMPESIPAAERERLASEAQAAIKTVVVPSYRKLLDFMNKEYLPACQAKIGISHLPNGTAAYAYLARYFTTTTLTPRQIHEAGLGEVARIRGEMEAIKSKVGFKGTLKDFFTFLRTDPRFFYKTPQELFEGYEATAKLVDGRLTRVFNLETLPRTPYGVEAIPEAQAPDTTTAYYMQPTLDGSRPGTYFVNLYKPEVRPRWEMMALTLHESVPGHHLQIARAQELGAVPQFRKALGFTAYVEGWGLYAESLGDEMGLYDDPYAKFGQLTYDMWRAVRLVVDTGMHQFDWDRQKAIDFFLDNTPKTEQDVVNEIDRYIAWPGQALAYKVGQLKIIELRRRAEKRLGPKFDLKAFHQTVLLSGAVPLDILEARVDAWVASQ